MLAPTKHAIGIKDDKTGIEVLLHLGIDTVEMKGKPFKAAVNVGDTVFKGQLLLEMNIESIKQANYDPIVLLVITKNTGEKFEVKKQSSIIHARQDLLYLN